MAHVLIRHRVSDYDRWKSVFDGFIEARRAGGEKSYRIFRGQDEPNNLTLLFEWNTFKNAHAFLASAALKDAMAKAGVTERPAVVMLEEAGHGVVQPV
jgi:hypothetical protein